MRPCRTVIQSLCSPSRARIRVKRDDLLGGGIGTKIRKYDYLIPYLKQTGVHRVGIVTSFFGSNAYAAPATLIPAGFDVVLIHPETKSVNKARAMSPRSLVGNALLSSKLLPLSQRIWIPMSKLDTQCAELEAQWNADLSSSGRKAVILPEGLAVAPALCGAAQLGQELASQVPDCEEIYLDAGTGHTAVGVIFALQRLRHPARITVVGSFPRGCDANEFFAAKLRQWARDFDEVLKHPDFDDLANCAAAAAAAPVTGLPTNWRALRPIIAPSFGSVPAGVLRYVREFMQSEGVLLDPVYSAKLMLTLEGTEERGKSGGTPVVAVLSGCLSHLHAQSAESEAVRAPM